MHVRDILVSVSRLNSLQNLLLSGWRGFLPHLLWGCHMNAMGVSGRGGWIGDSCGVCASSIIVAPPEWLLMVGWMWLDWHSQSPRSVMCYPETMKIDSINLKSNNMNRQMKYGDRIINPKRNFYCSRRNTRTRERFLCISGATQKLSARAHTHTHISLLHVKSYL